ncbi:MAG: hypothetical protein LBO69_04200 [Ignavibacteria bacterium]|jgi:uncharacterized membrane-anchored protein YhcB (DUF1043 family)|nr:hypothetical protein [Ignavibacteria bacterium]
MNDTIINGIFSLSGVLVGGLFMYLATKYDKDNMRLRNKMDKLSSQVASYWHLEKLYSDELSKHISKPPKTILQEYRDKIEEKGYERPTMTENGTKKYIVE